jgi:hypothetical protein
MRQGWGGRPVRQEQAQGILIATLGMRSRHFGYGISSPAGSCIWQVVGLQRSVREWAIRQGWNGGPVRQDRLKAFWLRASGCSRGISVMRGWPKAGRALRAGFLDRPGHARKSSTLRVRVL